MSLRKSFVCLLLAALLAAVVSAGAGNAQPGAAKETPDKEIARLIEQLGSKEFRAREQATRRLKELDEALPALRRAVKSSDLEMRRRAEGIIAVIEARLAERFIKEAVARVNEEGLDLFIDRMVLGKGYATDARWKASVELARALAKKAARAGAQVPSALEQDFLRLPVVTSWNAQNNPASRALLKGVDDRLNAVHGCLLLSSGSLEDINSTDRSILFVNGDIKSLNSTTDSVIFCNGTIKSFNYTKNCLIFCNGTVEGMNCTEDNAVFVRGELRSLNSTKNNVIEATRLTRENYSEGNTFVNRQALPANSKGDRLLQLAPSFLEVFQFFDPARAGLTFTMVEGDARVDKVAEGKPFARAGLRKGDLVLAVDRGKFLSADGFVRLLRRRVVAGQAHLKVQRGDRVLDIPVHFSP
jgi:hypothetical protein